MKEGSQEDKIFDDLNSNMTVKIYYFDRGSKLGTNADFSFPRPSFP